MSDNILIAIGSVVLTALAALITALIRRRYQPEEVSKVEAEARKIEAEARKIEKSTESELIETSAAFALALQKSMTGVQEQLTACRQREIEMMQKTSELQLQIRSDRDDFMKRIEAMEARVSELESK
jgi:hypothetical protein